MPAQRVAIGLFLLALGLPGRGAAWELTVDAPPGLASAAGRLERLDAAALEQALQHAGLSLPGAIHVALVAEGDSRALEAPSWVVGQAFRGGDIVIFPARIATYPYDSLESVLRHEVVHIALSTRAGGRPLPRWFHEGVAVSVETGWGVTDNLRLLLAAGSGPAVADLTRLFQSQVRPDTVEAYLLAAALVDDLRRRHGAAIPGAIAGWVAEGYAFHQAFERETGESPEQAAAHAWSTYRTLALWLPFLTSGTAVWTLILMLAFVAFFFRLQQRARRRQRWDEEDQ